MIRIGLDAAELSDAQVEALAALRVQCATDIVTMTTLATCGHPGGSLSSLDTLLLLYAMLAVDGSAPSAPLRDRIFISHGHISPGCYAVLSAFGFCDRDEAVRSFRRFGSPYGGHVEIGVPGVEWNTGNLGQGLSAAVGSALAARLHGANPRADLRAHEGPAAWRVACLMGDGEQQKGQIAEARRLARKYGCKDLVAIVDVNGLQIGGACGDVMPQDLALGWASDGWNVVDVDGHDLRALHGAIRSAFRGEAGDPGRPTVILARTVMSKGVPFMEGLEKWHGNALSVDRCREAIAALGGEDRLDRLATERAAMPAGRLHHPFPESQPPALDVGQPLLYAAEAKLDNRSAYGHAMKDLAARNNTDRVRVVAFSADLEGSVKLEGFHGASPAAFIEGGIQEHNTATAAGRLSREGFTPFYSTFAIFGVTEAINQQRLNAFNRANLKVVCTHCGTDLGEDGPTHQSVDYVGLLRSVFGWEVFVPADPNQCDRIVRTIANRPGCQFVGMGRSRAPVLLDESGVAPFYGVDRPFVPGRADVLRSGDAGAILAVGPMVSEALKAREIVRERTGKLVRVLNMASLVPIDADAVLTAAQTGLLVTAEDHNPETGLGGIVARVLADAGVACRLERAGVDEFPMSGAPTELFAAFRIDARGLADRVGRLLG